MFRNASSRWLLAAVLAAGLIVAIVMVARHKRPGEERQPRPVISTTSPTNPTPQASGPATRPLAYKNPPAVHTFMDVVRADFPTFPTTQPLAVPLELNQSARLIFREPIYLSKTSGDLWITRPDAPPLARLFKDVLDPNADDPQTHLLRKVVVFVQWLTSDSGVPTPWLICRRLSGKFEIDSPGLHGAFAFQNARKFQWNRAFPWDDKIVVPTDTGVSVIQLQPKVVESYLDLSPGPTTAPATAPARLVPPQVLPDGRGLLAWIPWTSGGASGNGAARYLDGHWNRLGPDQSWPEKIVQLAPLRDGAVFQFVARDDGKVTVQTSTLDQPRVDEAAIEKLVTQLADDDPDVRRKATVDLANQGPGAWPAMARLAPDQPPQAKMLLHQLLKDKSRPTLSGITLLGDRLLQLAARLSDGGVVFYAPQGVSIPDADGQPVVTAPAWLSVRPGHYVELLAADLIADLKSDHCPLDVVGDQWILSDDVRGPRLFYGNGFATLLAKDHRQFSQIVGVDQRGRWLFRKPSASDAPPDAPIQTLIIDPHLPDPTPRLPVWSLAIAQKVGWDKNNWPVLQNGAAYALTDSDWRPLAKSETFFTRVPESAPSPAPPDTADATQPTTAATQPDRPLAIGPDGGRYFGGLTDLRFIPPHGAPIDWPLPAIANGVGPAVLIVTKTGTLFLFNQPGRVLRIGRTPADAEPFKLQAVFTHNVPTIPHATRIWLDPAGRIDIAWENRLTILFPQGYIPRAMSEKMLDQGGLDADVPR